ncbi:hypothetical protein BDN71DRAFT_1437022 [Pleurotus eryngii]|uniref:Uncharacterized protein n=1 Tax=Pleurotus eryngii TaxID=5323 RepID=A0A9P6D053_PLEER|nr:hypothetical protein BDN71DRAFT_1437022 [Pleurotus eryngii]
MFLEGIKGRKLIQGAAGALAFKRPNSRAISSRRCFLHSLRRRTSSSQSRKELMETKFSRLHSWANSLSMLASNVSRRSSSLRKLSIPANKLFLPIISRENSTKDLECCWIRKTSIRVECSQSDGHRFEVGGVGGESANGVYATHAESDRDDLVFSSSGLMAEKVLALIEPFPQQTSVNIAVTHHGRPPRAWKGRDKGSSGRCPIGVCICVCEAGGEAGQGDKGAEWVHERGDNAAVGVTTSERRGRLGGGPKTGTGGRDWEKCCRRFWFLRLLVASGTGMEGWERGGRVVGRGRGRTPAV